MKFVIRFLEENGLVSSRLLPIDEIVASIYDNSP